MPDRERSIICCDDRDEREAMTMSTAVCQAADILGMRAELVDEFLAFVALTTKLSSPKVPLLATELDYAVLMDSLIDEYDRRM